MEGPDSSLAIAIDGGTSNTRARLLRQGRVIATARRAVGVRDEVLSKGERALIVAVRDVIREVTEAAQAGPPERIVAAGMLTSETGLAHLDHVLAPAGLDDLARGVALRSLPEVAERPVAFIPGVRTPAEPGEDGWAAADLMRGEECETIGAWLLLRETGALSVHGASAAVFVWPGSHTKLVEVDPAGKILCSHTTLAGELAQAVGRHTLLAASLPERWPDVLDPSALAAGTRLSAKEGLGRAAFLVRIAALSEHFDGPGRASFWIGAVVADDVARIARHHMLSRQPSLWIGGREPLRSVYATRLSEQYRGPVRTIDAKIAERASAVGALAIVRRSEQLGFC